MTPGQVRGILSYGRLQAALGEAAFIADGEATCLQHREPIRPGDNGCLKCQMKRATDKAASERLCDLMRQGIWKGPNHRR